MKSGVGPILGALVLLLSALLPGRAEQLPIRAYTTSDGLSQNSINRIFRDSRGFLWFCTSDGLSRFDGYAFTNYRMAQGLPHRWIGDMIETREGEYWIGTGGGLVLFNPAGEIMNRVIMGDEAANSSIKPMFTTFYPGADHLEQAGNVLLQDRAGAIWIGTEKGLFRLTRVNGQVNFQPVDVGLNLDVRRSSFVLDLCEDRYGTLWIVAGNSLYRRWPDGRVKRYDDGAQLPASAYRSVQLDRAGHVWAGRNDLLQLEAVGEYDSSVSIKRRLGAQEGLICDWVYEIFEAADGTLWLATNQGLYRWRTVDGTLRVYKKRNGLNSENVSGLNEDRDGNLWFGAIGALKLSRGSFVSYGEADGIMSVNLVFGDAEGQPYFFGRISNEQPRNVAQVANLYDTDPASLRRWRQLGHFDGHRFVWLKPRLPAGLESYGETSEFGGEQTVLQDHTGEWWLTSSAGVLRYPRAQRFTDLAASPPKKIYTTADGLAANRINHLFEDRRGDVWIATYSEARGGLARWERRTETLHDMTRAEGWPSSLQNLLIEAFAEDRAGNVWLGLMPNGLLRYRDGRFTRFADAAGVPPGWVNALLVDHAGRLWVATARGGLARADDPGAERPSFIAYTTAEGLTSEFVTCLAEDKFGRIYTGTRRGLDRLDPASNRIKHFTTADGLPEGELYSLFSDRAGDIWIGNQAGLSRYTPQRDVPAEPPPIWLSRLRVAGIEHRVSAVGEQLIALPELAATQNQLQIDFIALSFAPGETLRYQYKLEGSESDWSAPNEQRSVNFANLAPGSYRFLVRAVNADGITSAQPAVVTFRILTPLWQRWWFWAAVTLLLGLMAVASYRARMARLLALANMRTRIATDLHDDIGANLTRISILSEVARQQLSGGQEEADAPLASIARISRESAAAMNDIVWAINPERDQLLDLVRRMRQHAEEIFAGRDITLKFDAPDAAQNLKLSVDVRRDLFLIFKEAVNNTARHSDCTRVEIDFRVGISNLVLEVSDNGVGFDLSAERDGHGLTNMRRRAKNLGGALAVESSAGKGTTASLKIPLARARRSD